MATNDLFNWCDRAASFSELRCLPGLQTYRPLRSQQVRRSLKEEAGFERAEIRHLMHVLVSL